MIGMRGMRDDLIPTMDIKDRSTPDAPRLISRHYFYNNVNTTFVTPGGTGFAIMRGIASGAYDPSYGQGFVGAGGDFARTDMVIGQGRPLVIHVRPLAAYEASVSLDGVKVMRAAPPTNVFLSQPAAEGASIGTVVVRGSMGTLDVPAGKAWGGSPGQETSTGDNLLLNGKGAYVTPYEFTFATYGGGGARPPVANQQILANGGGILVLEFWTSDPR